MAGSIFFYMDRKSEIFFDNLSKVRKSRLVSVIIPANNTNGVIGFGEQPDLRYARILGIQTYVALDFAQTQPTGIAVLDGALMPNISLTLETNDADDLQIFHKMQNKTFNVTEEATNVDNPNATGRFRTTSQNIKYSPLSNYHVHQNSATNSFQRNLPEFSNLFIIWEKSFITLNPIITPLVNTAVVFNVYYTFTNIFGGQIQQT